MLALCWHLRDYVRKCDFRQVIVGLSGRHPIGAHRLHCRRLRRP